MFRGSKLPWSKTGTLLKIKVRFSRKFVPVAFKVTYIRPKTCTVWAKVSKHDVTLTLWWNLCVGASSSVQKMTEIWLIMCSVFVVCCCSLGIEKVDWKKKSKKSGIAPILWLTFTEKKCVVDVKINWTEIKQLSPEPSVIISLMDDLVILCQQKNLGYTSVMNILQQVRHKC